jgi:hypothetical protein
MIDFPSGEESGVPGHGPITSVEASNLASLLRTLALAASRALDASSPSDPMRSRLEQLQLLAHCAEAAGGYFVALLPVYVTLVPKGDISR